MNTRRGKGNNGQGMNWITQVRRLAIYLRDGLACVWCRAGIEDSIVFTLDHVVCREHGGSNRSDNLVTCCGRCNSVRQSRLAFAFAFDVSVYTGEPTELVNARLRKQLAAEVSTAEAKLLIARRGSARRVLDNLQEGSR